MNSEKWYFEVFKIATVFFSFPVALFFFGIFVDKVGMERDEGVVARGASAASAGQLSPRHSPPLLAHCETISLALSLECKLKFDRTGDRSGQESTLVPGRPQRAPYGVGHDHDVTGYRSVEF